jgi:phospholipid/cholesterol/gamma-HCH transport system substrate-binding protein
VGTVNKMNIVNDSVIEISMRIENNLKSVIKKNSIVSIGTDGLVGNKVVYIFTNKKYSPNATDGDVLLSKKPVDTDEMLKTLNKTNNNISVISDSLRSTIVKINGSKALWDIMNDDKFHTLLINTLENIDNSSESLLSMTKYITKGKGNIGKVLYDSSLYLQLLSAIDNIENASLAVNNATENIDKISFKLKENIENTKGNVHKILTDSLLYDGIFKTIENAERGTENFNLNMKALQNNFLFRNYFKKLNNKKANAHLTE